MFNQATRFALVLVLAACPADYHVQGLNLAEHVIGSVRQGAVGRGDIAAFSAVRPSASTCLSREMGGRPRRRGCYAVGMNAGGDVSAAAVPEFDLAEKKVEELWMRVKKQLISVGKGGIKPSHVRSLNSLIAAHTLVKVKVNIPNADLEEVGLELAGKGGLKLGGGDGDEASPAVGVSVVTVNPNQKVILFANTEFLASQARGEPL
ncbi:unnamed protein product [Ectocarpus sp. 12 AP-2014]